MTREIVIASKNKGKIREIRQIYAELPVSIVEQADAVDDLAADQHAVRTQADALVV